MGHSNYSLKNRNNITNLYFFNTNVGVIKSVLGLFILLALLHSVFGIDAKVVSDLLSDV